MDRPAKVENAGSINIITLTGERKGVENRLAAELAGLTDGLAAEHLLIDFTNVAYLTSAELGTLVRLHKDAAAAGGLTLFNLNPDIYETLVVTRLSTYLGVCREPPPSGGP